MEDGKTAGRKGGRKDLQTFAAISVQLGAQRAALSLSVCSSVPALSQVMFGDHHAPPRQRSTHFSLADIASSFWEQLLTSSQGIQACFPDFADILQRSVRSCVCRPGHAHSGDSR